MFGLPTEHMVGHHIGRYLPLTSKSHMDLLKQPAGRSNEDNTQLRRKRSSMKVERPPPKDENVTDGSHDMHVTHLVRASRNMHSAGLACRCHKTCYQGRLGKA